MSKVVDKVVEVDETVVVVDEDEGKSKTLAGLSSTRSLLISWLSKEALVSLVGSCPGPFV